MSEDKAPYSKKIFRYDVDAYGVSIKEKDFIQANVFANRIMSNAAIFNEKTFGITGFILKEIASDGVNIQQSKDDELLADFAKKSSKVVGSIITMLNNKRIDLKQLWLEYHQHQRTTHSTFMSKQEKATYLQLDEDFSSRMIHELVLILSENKNILKLRNNNFLKGILNEIGRVAKVHGLKRDDEQFASLLIMAQRIDEYIKQTQKDSYVSTITKELLPLIDEIIMINNKTDRNEVIDNVLWETIKIWRLYFLKYMEIRQPTVSIKEEYVSSEEKEMSKLVDEVTKKIEEDVGL